VGKMRRGEMCVFITECSPLRRAAEQGSEDRKTRRASLSPRPVTAHSHPPARVGHDCCNRPHFLPQCPSISPVSSQSGRPRERVLFIGTQFSILYTSMYSPAETATPRA
jgi:hypothetical protein